MRGAGGEAAEVARTVFARRALRARISPVGVAELKCIWPPGLRGVANTDIFSSARGPYSSLTSPADFCRVFSEMVKH